MTTERMDSVGVEISTRPLQLPRPPRKRKLFVKKEESSAISAAKRRKTSPRIPDSPMRIPESPKMADCGIFLDTTISNLRAQLMEANARLRHAHEEIDQRDQKIRILELALDEFKQLDVQKVDLLNKLDVNFKVKPEFD